MDINIFNKQTISEIKRKLFPKWKSEIAHINIDVIDELNVNDRTNTSVLTVNAVEPNKKIRFIKQYIIKINAINILNHSMEIIFYKKDKKYRITILNP